MYFLGILSEKTTKKTRLSSLSPTKISPPSYKKLVCVTQRSLSDGLLKSTAEKFKGGIRKITANHLNHFLHFPSLRSPYFETLKPPNFNL